MEKWENEPDSLDWEYNGLTCAIRRVGVLGHLCGYVGVKENHPWHGKGYDDQVRCPGLAEKIINPEKVGYITLLCASVNSNMEEEMASISLLLEAHGGITFSGPMKSMPDDLWFFGFDCAHCGDLVPKMSSTCFDGQVYRDIEYVKAEVQSLADRLGEIKE